jgi:hypothetical protein
MRQAVLAAFLVAAPAAATAQATNPPYLSQFPSVDKVVKAMEVADPRESALRKMGALWQLEEVIKALSGRREFRGLLPDEAKVMGEYQVAAYYIGRAIDSAFPGRYGNWPSVSMNTPYRFSRTDPRFGVEGIDVWALLPPAVVDQFYQVVGNERARFAARARADSESMRQAQAAQAPEPGKGEEEARIRRCVESGRSQMQCVMEGFGRGLMDLADAVVPGLGLKKEAIHGIRMGGVYPGEGNLSFTFHTDHVIVACADIVPEGHEYSVVAAPEGARITIANTPRPIVLTVRADGRLTGTGPTEITGQVQTGTQFGTRTWSDGRTEPISRPVYETLTRRCNIGSLAAGGPSPPLGSGSAVAATVLNLALGSPDPDAGKPTPAGLRMSGEYGTRAALDLEFRPEGVVVGCGEVTALRPYAVAVQGSRVMVNVENGATLFTLAVGADGSLGGTGTVRVDGRRVTGTGPDGSLAYAPRSATCPLGTLAPARGQPSATAQGAAAARASLGQPAAGASSPGNGPAFQITGGLPAPAFGGSALANRSFLLLDTPLDNVLQEAGVARPAGVSAPRVLEQACNTVAGEAACARVVQVLSTHTVATITADANGNAQTPDLVAGKTYYLFGSAVSLGRKLTWHLPLTARAGWTRVVLSATNQSP